MGIPVKLPIMVATKNVGAMFTTENPSSDVRTRRMNIMYHFIREHVEDDFIKIFLLRR
jgi:hypothetical protein